MLYAWRLIQIHDLRPHGKHTYRWTKSALHSLWFKWLKILALFLTKFLRHEVLVCFEVILFQVYFQYCRIRKNVMHATYCGSYAEKIYAVITFLSLYFCIFWVLDHNFESLVGWLNNYFLLCTCFPNDCSLFYRYNVAIKCATITPGIVAGSIFPWQNFLSINSQTYIDKSENGNALQIVFLLLVMEFANSRKVIDDSSTKTCGLFVGQMKLVSKSSAWRVCGRVQTAQSGTFWMVLNFHSGLLYVKC